MLSPPFFASPCPPFQWFASAQAEALFRMLNRVWCDINGKSHTMEPPGRFCLLERGVLSISKSCKSFEKLMYDNGNGVWTIKYDQATYTHNMDGGKHSTVRMIRKTGVASE